MPDSKKSLSCSDFLNASQIKSSEWLSQFEAKLNSHAQAECFSTRNKIVGTYRSLRLRRFGRVEKTHAIQTLIIPPLAVHDAGITDLIAGNSLIATLRDSGVEGLHTIEWNRLTPESSEQSFDACLSDLNIAIDDLGGRVNLVGLCVGGLLALVLAARFPGKIARLVLAGTPVDMDAQLSTLSLHARKLTSAGQKALPFDVGAAEQWLTPLAVTAGAERTGLDVLQRDLGSFARADLAALSAFEAWAERKYDLSAAYMRDLITRIGAANEIARGEFIALGRRIDLKNIRAPIFVLAGERDEIAPPLQAFAVLDLVGTAQARQRRRLVPTHHLSLFAGRHVLRREWRMIAGWLQSCAPLARSA